MKNRKTLDKKESFLQIRVTPRERDFIKIKSAERGISMTRLVLESVRRYLYEGNDNA